MVIVLLQQRLRSDSSAKLPLLLEIFTSPFLSLLCPIDLSTPSSSCLPAIPCHIRISFLDITCYISSICHSTRLVRLLCLIFHIDFIPCLRTLPTYTFILNFHLFRRKEIYFLEINQHVRHVNSVNKKQKRYSFELLV